MNRTTVAQRRCPINTVISDKRGDRMKQPKPSTSTKRSSVKDPDEAEREKLDEEVTEESQEEAPQVGLEIPSIEMPEDESKLSHDEKAARITQIYLNGVRAIWLPLGLWVTVNVYNSDLEAARSKNPHKDKSFNKIAGSKEMHPDLKGPLLRRYVSAAATWQELGTHDVDTDRTGYSHCREIAKIPTLAGRIAVGNRVVAESLTVKQTIEAVQAEIAKTKKAAKTDADTDLCELARTVIQRLDLDPILLSEDPDLSEMLLDSAQVRTEFNFREQSKIYGKAEKIKKEQIREKSDLEHRLEDLQQSINFLEDLMDTFDGKEEDAETAA